MARYYGSSEERGYGTAHQKLRRQLMAKWRPGDPCARCGRPMWDKKAIDLGHTDDRSGYRGLEHSFCNRKAGAGTANRTKTQPKRIRPGGREYHQPCQFCGIVSRHAAQSCVICGGHFHPGNGRVQWACSRACGVEYKRRKYGHASNRPPKSKPSCENCGKPCKTTASRFCSRVCAVQAKLVSRPGPTSRVQYYTCRYCGKLGATKNTGQRREVCPDIGCQARRLNQNRMRHDGRPEPAPARPSLAPVSIMAVKREPPIRPAHHCPSCGRQTPRHRWCDDCLCAGLNAKGRRCGNQSGNCEQHDVAA